MNLKFLRERANMSQEQVARKLDVDQSAVSKWETGVYRPLRKYHKKLAKLYGVSVDDLLRDDQGDPSPEIQ